MSQPLYGIKPPSQDPARQEHLLKADDGVELYVETWLPAPKDGHVPPQELPTVLVMSPYMTKGVAESLSPMEELVSRGYAFSQMHLRGTGESGGCLGRLGPNEADDGARAVEYLGRDASWSNGVVGTYGRSHRGGSQTAVAAFGDPERTKFLKAMVVVAPDISRYQYSNFDGVPYFLHAPTVTYVTNWGRPGRRTTAADYPQKLSCQPEIVANALDTSGDFTDFDRKREHRLGVDNVTAAVLSVHGHRDLNVTPLAQSGFFEQLPASTPKAGLFGVFDHDNPDRHASGVRPEWERPDFRPMVIAWYDRWLKGLDSGADGWPTAQVQGTDGQWRAEADWPLTGGRAGRLALGPSSVLGASEPAGATRYREAFFENTPGIRPPGTAAVFESAPLPERLELTGQPVLDIWVTLDRPDAHLAALVQAFDSDGAPIPYGRVLGFRSMRHLEPLERNIFVQSQGRPAPVGTPIRVQVRLNPSDLVVPKDGRLRLTIAGSQSAVEGIETLVRKETGVPVPQLYEDPSELSGAATEVTILHDCEHPSALRFEMPNAEPELLNVREKDEPADEPLADNRPFEVPVSDGGGLATAPVCGEGPEGP